MGSESESFVLNIVKNFSILVFGGMFDGLFVRFALRMRGTLYLLLRLRKGVNKHTKEKKHSCSICVRTGLVWVCLNTDPHPPSPCWHKESWGGRVTRGTPQTNSSVFMLLCLFPLCGPHCFSTSNWESVSIKGCQTVTNCKTIPWWWISSVH